jgi:hypothetical protein
MKKRIRTILATVALLAAVTLPIFPAALPGEHVRQTGNQHVALHRADLECQSGHACGG